MYEIATKNQSTTANLIPLVDLKTSKRVVGTLSIDDWRYDDWRYNDFNTKLRQALSILHFQNMVEVLMW